MMTALRRTALFFSTAILLAACGRSEKKPATAPEPTSSPQPVLPPESQVSGQKVHSNFLEMCLDKNLKAEARRTVQFILKNAAGTDDCKAGSAALTDKRDLRLTLVGGAEADRLTDFSPLVHFRNLVRLEISGHKIADVGVIKNLTKLRNLDISGNDLKVVSIPPELRKLEILDVGSNNLTRIDSLLKIESLYTLDVSENPLEGNKLASLPPKLKSFQANKTGLKPDESWISAGTAAHLVHLSVSGNGITDVRPLRHFTKLKQLDLANNAIKDASSLSSMKEIISMNLAGNSEELKCPLQDADLCLFDTFPDVPPIPE